MAEEKILTEEEIKKTVGSPLRSLMAYFLRFIIFAFLCYASVYFLGDYIGLFALLVFLVSMVLAAINGIFFVVFLFALPVTVRRFKRSLALVRKGLVEPSWGSWNTGHLLLVDKKNKKIVINGELISRGGIREVKLRKDRLIITMRHGEKPIHDAAIGNFRSSANEMYVRLCNDLGFA